MVGACCFLWAHCAAWIADVFFLTKFCKCVLSFGMDVTPRKLTPKQQKFVEEYLCDLNATQAALRAGYSVKTAMAIGAENLKKPQIHAAVQAEMDKRSARTEVTADSVLKEICKIAFSDIRNVFDENGRLLPVHMMSPDVSASISSIKISTKSIPGSDPVDVEHIAELKFWDKNSSLEKLGKHLKLFNDVGSRENPLTVNTELTDEQLTAIAMGKKQ